MYQVLYGQPLVERNEALFFICQMVWVKLVLKKVVDWPKIKHAKIIMMPKEQSVSRRVLNFSNKGLNVSRRQTRKEEEDDTKKSEEDDNNSNRTCLSKINTILSFKIALKVLHEQKQAQRDKAN